MPPDQITVAVLFWGSAVVIALDALKHDGFKGKALWAVTAVFVVAGFAVRPLWNIFPDVAGFMLAIASFPPTWFFLLAVAYMVFRTRFVPSAPSPNTLPSAVEDSGLRTRIAYLEDKQKGIIEDYQRMSGLEIRFSDEMDKMKRLLGADMDKVGSNCGALQERLNGQVAALEKLEVTIKDQYERLRHSLWAIHARELLHEMQSEIDHDASLLSAKFEAGERHDTASWDSWEKVHSRWERTLSRWLDNARWYAKGVKTRVMFLDDKEFDEFPEWSPIKDTLFVDARAVRRFQRHQIIHKHWLNVRGDVEGGVQKVAFQGGTEKEQHGGDFHQ